MHITSVYLFRSTTIIKYSPSTMVHDYKNIDIDLLKF